MTWPILLPQLSDAEGNKKTVVCLTLGRQVYVMIFSQFFNLQNKTLPMLIGLCIPNRLDTWVGSRRQSLMLSLLLSAAEAILLMRGLGYITH